MRVAERNLDKMQWQLAFAEAVDAQRRRHDHEQAVELHAVYLELLSRLLSVAEPSGISASAPDDRVVTCGGDFIPLLESAQRMLGKRLNELHRQISAESAGQGSELSKTQRATCLG